MFGEVDVGLGGRLGLACLSTGRGLDGGGGGWPCAHVHSVWLWSWRWRGWGRWAMRARPLVFAVVVAMVGFAGDGGYDSWQSARITE